MQNHGCLYREEFICITLEELSIMVSKVVGFLQRGKKADFGFNIVMMMKERT